MLVETMILGEVQDLP
ncbi:hypothetical protein OIU79_006557, partial [Salix purpurea]